ncbi:MAG: hypothetical protein Q7R33_09715 [Nitrosarchaeum sp.]|nr:hypothetical protein [Nitrosarchaeum sp.]
MEYFNVERVFFEHYINELSSDSFKVLLKMLYLARCSDDDVNIRSNRSLRRIIGLNISIAESIWDELIQKELVVKKDRQHKTIYMLNSKKIKQDNLENTENITELRNLKISIYNVGERSLPTNFDVTDEQIKNKISNVMVNADAAMLDALFKTVKLLQQYHLDRDKKFSLATLGLFLTSAVKFNNQSILVACQKYNSGNFAANRGFKYVLKMIEYTGMELRDRKEVQTEKLNVENDKRKEDGEQKFAIKVASGQANDSLIFQKLLKNDIEKLKILWQQGAEILKERNQEDLIRSWTTIIN